MKSKLPGTVIDSENANRFSPEPGPVQSSENHAGHTPRKTVYMVQIMRGLAAAAVVLYHTHIILAQARYGGVEIFGNATTRGWMGVNFFFVLSGFIILLAHYRDIGDRSRIGTYVWRRFVRVYPIYWIFTSIYIAAAVTGIGYPEFGTDILNLLSSYTLVLFNPAPHPPLQVAWTLFFEINFYIIFVAILVNLRIGLVVFALWTLAILVNSLYLGETGFGPFNMWNIYFVVGMGVYLLYRHARGVWAIPLLCAGLIALIAVFALGLVPNRMVIAQHDPVFLLWMSGIFALILAGATLLERDRTFRFPKTLLLLGDASYSVYLIHSPVLSAFATLNHKLIPGLLPGWLLFFVAAFVAIVAGVVAHLLIERPLLNAVHLRIGRLNRRRSSQTAAG